MLPSEVSELPFAETNLLRRYWDAEPWGAWRDNLHAAVIARAAIAAGGFKAPKLDVFMYRQPDPNAAKSAGNSLIDMMKTLAVRKRRKKSK